MKKSLYLIICMLGSILYAQAQEALYFHCKDGKSFACTIDEIDHIGFSKVGDSEYNNQIVYLKDSTQVEVLLEDVDSVGFTNPAPVLKDNGFIMDKSFMAYVSDADTLKFTMAKDTPASMLPKKGDVVASTYDNTAFPDGIMARVVSITETANGYLYECEKAGIDDLYDEFLYCGYAEEFDAGARTRGGIDVELWNKTYDSLINNLFIGDNITIGGNLHLNSRARLKIDLHKEKGQPSEAKFRFTHRFDSSINASIAGKIQKEFDPVPISPWISFGAIPTPIPAIFFTPMVKFNVYFEAAADVKAALAAHMNIANDFSLEMKNNKWSATENKSNSDAGFDEFSLSIDGWTGFGLQPEFLITLCGSQTGVSVNAKAGIRFTASFKFDATQYLKDNSFYDGVKDSKITVTIPMQAWFQAQAGFFGPAVKSANIYFVNTSIPVGSGYFLPAFSGLDVKDTGSNSYEVYADIIDRNVFFFPEFGLAAFDSDNQMVASEYLGKYMITEKPPKNISTTFKLPSNKDYTFAPIVKLFGVEMRAGGTLKTGVVGSWYLEHPLLTDEYYFLIYTFLEDGTFTVTYLSYPPSYSSEPKVWSKEIISRGTYKVVGDKITLKYSTGGTEEATWSRVDDYLYWNGGFDPNYMIYWPRVIPELQKIWDGAKER